jgi:hypothetical protein
VLDIGYALSSRFPDPTGAVYRRADARTLRQELFCGDVYLADTDTDRELSTAWGWVPVLDFAWALCDIVEQLARAPRGRAPGPYRAELDFTESTDRLRFELRPAVTQAASHARTAGAEPSGRGGMVTIEADWTPADEPPLVFSHAELRRESRDFLHDLLADLVDLHDDLGENPTVWQLQARFPRVP